MNKYFCLITFFILTSNISFSQKKKETIPLSPVYQSDKGNLAYTPDTQGNRIPDFSYCGYKASEQPIPTIETKVFVKSQKGDATQKIQSAIDFVSNLPLDKNGFRGAVQLDKGQFEVKGNLIIKTSGVVLRGAGIGEKGTVIIGAGDSRETLIRIKGKNDRTFGKTHEIINPYIPVNAQKISVSSSTDFKVGDKVQIHRPSTKEWIELLKTDHFGGGVTALGWKPNQRDLFWDRTITAINANEITLDVPLTTALDSTFGGGKIATYQWNGRISNIGIENLQLISTYDKANLKDEDHRWMAISFENVSDGWVRQTTFKHFAGSAVNILASAKRITVEDCISTEPISEIGGQRRYTFFTSGQQTLFQRIYAENGYHDFAVGYCATGPNAFVQCESKTPFSFSGTIDSWASGVLFDIVNVDGNALRFANRGQDGQGAGWSAANSVFWQCSASMVECAKPPTAQNWAFGTWAQFAGDGHWEMSNEHIKPRSLFYAQLKDRLGNEVENRTFLMSTLIEASSSPKVEVAMELTKNAVSQAFTLQEFIVGRMSSQALPQLSVSPQTIGQLSSVETQTTVIKTPTMQIKNGWLVRDDEILTGRKQEVPWWSGVARPHGLANAKPHITRFVPGQSGLGLTDDLEELTDWMQQNNVTVLDHNYGLWYDRRRDDHERIRRMDGEVWTPFYELPFARSGKETAWDGLSKYDLTKYNKWYWGRLKQFADLADQKNLVLIHQNYFQHNIIEAGAHYADFPWRPANNINNTGFPEPVPYAGDKRIFMAEQFYDISHPIRRKIHRDYIRKCLSNFAENSGVIQLIGAEYTGPLHFVEFWIDVIKEWEKETGKNVTIGLSTTKDVQDAILADKNRSKTIDLIDIRYWHNQFNGTIYEPKGGQNLAPRQHARLLNPKRSSFEQIYKAVREYRQNFPDKAVVYSGDSFDANGWAVFMAGGSLANLPQNLPPDFLKNTTQMNVIELSGKPKNQWALGYLGKNYIIYTETNENVNLDLTNFSGDFTVNYINPKDGKIIADSEIVQGRKVLQINSKNASATVIWITKK
ncbi:hypothetical protein LV89_01456 [Arcicella aurantiaca]|uniref:DUF6298 domain-containing protein n=1 Tax=Arcicella aurantiaca TaxID=591202 RepID=A0A316EAT9_9BACT|nr:DUF6298 domain-containing protein [Arcicella aurantiaca]PWK27565.1 hypothetical protein LV89_01456 [Arcicella aurantiaca]